MTSEFPFSSLAQPHSLPTEAEQARRLRESAFSAVNISREWVCTYGASQRGERFSKLPVLPNAVSTVEPFQTEVSSPARAKKVVPSAVRFKIDRPII